LVHKNGPTTKKAQNTLFPMARTTKGDQVGIAIQTPVIRDKMSKKNQLREKNNRHSLRRIACDFNRQTSTTSHSYRPQPGHFMRKRSPQINIMSFQIFTIKNLDITKTQTVIHCFLLAFLTPRSNCVARYFLSQRRATQDFTKPQKKPRSAKNH